MADISNIATLEAELSSGAKVVKPNDSAYEEAIERWSESCKKRAVRPVVHEPSLPRY